jgi:hypothetical protein
LCKFYSTPSDLGAKISRSLTQLRKQCPATGWIRADILDRLASSDELLKLMRENEELRDKLYHLGLEKPATADLLASGDEMFEIYYFFERHTLNPDTNRFRKFAEDKGSLEVSWDDLFALLAPDLLEKRDYWRPSRVLVDFIERNVYRELQEKYPDERFRDFRISSRSCDTIMLQFRALKFFSINGEGKWSLTPYGDNYMTSLLAVPKGETKKAT